VRCDLERRSQLSHRAPGSVLGNEVGRLIGGQAAGTESSLAVARQRGLITVDRKSDLRQLRQPRNVAQELQVELDEHVTSRLTCGSRV
jgi:hypothetical protein